MSFEVGDIFRSKFAESAGYFIVINVYTVKLGTRQIFDPNNYRKLPKKWHREHSVNYRKVLPKTTPLVKARMDLAIMEQLKDARTLRKTPLIYGDSA